MNGANVLPVMLLLGCGLAGQQPPAKSPEPQGKLSAAQVARATALLRRHGERSKSLQVLVADYVQRRTTSISKRPLISKGGFLFVKKPACVVFRAAPPRASVVRLTPGRYEVFRPRRKRLERFLLGSPELARGLFAALGGDADKLLADFAVCSLVEVAGEVRIGLKPSEKAVRERLRELSLRLRSKDAELRAVSYRDHAGDLIEIELANPQPNPKRAPSAELEVPKGTAIIEHKVERKVGGQKSKSPAEKGK